MRISFCSGMLSTLALGVVVLSNSLSLTLLASGDVSINNDRKNYSRQGYGDDSQAEVVATTFKNALTAGQILELLHLIDEADEQQKNWMLDTLVDRMKSDPDVNVRNTAVYCMVRFPRLGADAVATALLSDPARQVRTSAAYALDLIGTERHVDALYQAVKDDMGESGHGRPIARNAIIALGDIGGERTVEILNEIWNSDQFSRACRDVTLGALGKAGDLHALGTLEAVLTGNNESLRESAVHGLQSLAQKNPRAEDLVTTIAKLLRAHLGDSNPRISGYVAQALGHVGVPADIVLLEPLLSDEHSSTVYYTDEGVQKTKTVYRVRARARKAIARIQSRFPSTKLDSPPDGPVKTANADPIAPNESLDSGPATTDLGLLHASYILIAICVAVIAVVFLVVLRKKRRVPAASEPE